MRASLIVMAAGLFVAAGCNKSSTTTISDEIVIGEYGSMTGSEANFGQSTHNGVQMAVDEINAAGGLHGKKVKLVSYDDQGKTSEAGTAVTRLITSDNALAVIGEVASSLSIAGGQICQQHGVPMVTPSSTDDHVTETGDYVFRVCFIDTFQGWVMAKFATDPAPAGLGAKKVAMLIDQRQAYAQGLGKHFSTALTKLGGTIVADEKYQGGDQDFSAQLTRIKGTAPDAIYIPGYYNDVANIAKQVRGMGITVPMMGGDGWESVTDIGSDAIQGAYYSNHYDSADVKNPAVKSFVDKYTSRFKRAPDSMAALGYDSVMIVKSAIEKSPPAPLAAWRTAVRDAIKNTSAYPGVTGSITIDEHRNAHKPAVVLKIVGKSTTTAATISPQ